MESTQESNGDAAGQDPKAREQDVQLDRAKEAAASGDPLTMVEYLHKSYALAGLVRRLQAKWPDLASSEIDLCVSRAVDAAYESIRSGKKVFWLIAFLWKVADRRAFDRQRSAIREIPTDPAILDATVGDDGGIRDIDAEAAAEDQRQEKITRAIAIARTLLPRLGQENVQRVMGLVIDAAEQELVDLPNAHIAEVLGLSIDTVKQSKSRGFQRLRRLAREEKLIDENTLASLAAANDEPEETGDENKDVTTTD